MGSATKALPPARARKGTKVGKVVVDFELTNAGDEEMVRRKQMKPDAVRRIRVQGAIVDTGSTVLSIPEELIKQLGLSVLRQAWSIYADGRREPRNVYGNATIHLMGRTDTVTVLAGHKGQPPLLGQIPLEGLDLHVDCKHQRLIPNPESPDMPLYTM